MPAIERARKLLLVAWLGIILPPLSFYALYLLLKALFGRDPLSRQGQINLAAGMIWMIPCLLVMCITVLGVIGMAVLSFIDE